MRLTVTMFTTLDGVVQGPGGPDEDRDGGFDLGGWVVPYFNDDIGAAVDGWFAQADAFLLGRRTYEIFAGSWGKLTEPDDPVGGAFYRLPKYVASRTLTDLAWEGSELLEGDVAEAVEALKQRPGRELQVHGSGDLVHTLTRHGLVDEYRLVTFPVVLGKGKRLFADGAKPTALSVVEHTGSANGVSIDVYAVAGEPTFGRVELDDSGNARFETGEVS
jgi:dihydrofolate reductase